MNNVIGWIRANQKTIKAVVVLVVALGLIEAGTGGAITDFFASL